MPPELRTIERASSPTGALRVIRDFDQTGASSRADWIRPGDAQSVPYNHDAACAQRAMAGVIRHLFSGSSAASTNKPRGLRSASFVVDSGCLVPSPHEAHPYDEAFRRLRRQLWARLNEEPLEDGVTHSAEEVVERALSGPAGQRAAIEKLVATEPNPEFSAAVLRLAGRVGRSAGSDWRGALVGTALRSSSATLREAAVEAIEQWEDAGLLPLLRAHTESVSWLQAYIDDVIDDLTE